MSTTALIELALALLPKIQVGVTEFVNWLNSLRTAAIQSAEWTPEYQAAWRDALLYHGITAEEMPDPK